MRADEKDPIEGTSAYQLGSPTPTSDRSHRRRQMSHRARQSRSRRPLEGAVARRKHLDTQERTCGRQISLATTMARLWPASLPNKRTSQRGGRAGELQQSNNQSLSLKIYLVARIGAPIAGGQRVATLEGLREDGLGMQRPLRVLVCVRGVVSPKKLEGRI